LLWPAQVLPALPEEPQDLVHLAAIGQAQADGPVEDVLADPEVVAVAAALAVNWPDELDLVELVGGSGLRPGPLLAGQQRGEPDARRGQTVALEHALDGARVGQRTDVEGLAFGQDGRGPNEAVAGRRRGVGLEPATDAEDGSRQLGREALGDLVGGVAQVVQALGTRLPVAAPPLAEPEIGAAQGLADVPDRSAAEAKCDGTLACRAFVVPKYLRSAAAGGCPRRSL